MSHQGTLEDELKDDEKCHEPIGIFDIISNILGYVVMLPILLAFHWVVTSTHNGFTMSFKEWMLTTYVGTRYLYEWVLQPLGISGSLVVVLGLPFAGIRNLYLANFVGYKRNHWIENNGTIGDEVHGSGDRHHSKLIQLGTGFCESRIIGFDIDPKVKFKAKGAYLMEAKFLDGKVTARPEVFLRLFERGVTSRLVEPTLQEAKGMKKIG